LGQAAKYRTLPHAEELHQGKVPNPWFGGSKYVLRGKRVAEVLSRIEPAPVDFDREEPSRPERLEEESLVIKSPFDLRDRNDIRIRKLKQGMALQAGYQLTTPEYIRAFIEFPDGSEIIVEPNTMIIIESGGIFVCYGKIWFWNLFTGPIGRIEIRTAHATINLTGTEAGMDVSPDATIVWMLEGQSKAILDGKDLGSITANEAAVIRRREVQKNPSLTKIEKEVFKERFNDGKEMQLQKAGLRFPSFPSFIGALGTLPSLGWVDIRQ